MHTLLARQLRKAFAGKIPDSPELAAFISAIDDAYRAADDDRRQLERSLELASEELYARNRRLESELEERKRLEVELRLAEKLRAVGQLAAGIAHEINTPIQYVGDSIQFLRDAFVDLGDLFKAYDHALDVAAAGGDCSEAALRLTRLAADVDFSFLREEIPKALERCTEGNDRVTKIVRALKTFSHPDAREQQPADINAAIENTLVVAANEIKYVADVALELEAMPHVFCHLGDVQQVLLNLFVNAAHAIADRFGETENRGAIRVSTRRDGADVIIEVADDGAGIPLAIRDRIFEPFFTTKELGRGTGQGLSIARTLVVDRHGGQLTFETIPGGGTTFRVRLPIDGRAQTDARGVEAA